MKLETYNIKNQKSRIAKVFHVSSFKFQERGFAAIISILAVLGMGLIFSSGFLFVTLRNSEALKDEINSAQSYYTAEAGIEDAIYRVRYNLNTGISNTVTIGDFTATTTVVTAGNTKTIAAQGGGHNVIRNAQTTLTVDTSEADFFYGVQVGEGGVEMDQNSTIIGSIYSNGNVIGSSGARIAGDAWIAGGASPTLDAKWETQNADLAFGAATGGSIITMVDSGGSVGTYSSLALGLDGFARISYIDDASNDNLKFIRCADDDCSSPTRATVDSSPEVDEATSIALDSNDFAYITYYDDGSDDQEFARCTNADCTTRVLTTIESTNNVGDTSATKIGSDGFARIAYFQDDNGDVKYARCTDADCASSVRNTVDATGYSG